MSRRGIRFHLLLVGPPLIASLAAFADARAQEGCTSGSCHAALLTATTVHPPTEICDTCHESVTAPHPQAGKRTFKLAQEPPELCSTCHDALGKKSHVHAPVTEGMCTACHDPHASAEPKLLSLPINELCRTCHADHVEFEFLHGPVSAGACTACHEPHDSDLRPLLRKEERELCLGCHVDLADELQKKAVHAALENGCTSCHNPHGAAFPKLLATEGQEVCLQCHDSIGEKVTRSPVVHAAVESGCASCHSPHASDHDRLLVSPEKETCLGCHDAILTKSMTTLHGPIDDGKCTSCHDPHGSQFARLFTREFPADPYVPYTDTEFALCFTCHERSLLQYPDTSFATNFRDGERNLHYLHVRNEEKARSCKLCHNPHGGSNPVLVAESVPFGKWDLPLKFAKTETGGSCAPGCHKPQSYDRKRPKPQG